MNKQYRVIKDTPELKKGEILTLQNHQQYTRQVYVSPQGEYVYDPKDVETKPEWFRKIEEFTILSFITTNGTYSLYELCEESGEFAFSSAKSESFSLDEMLKGTQSVESGYLKIHSVRRDEDGIVFTIGDLVRHKSYSFPEKTIHSFHIDRDFMRALGESPNSFNFRLDSLVKVEKRRKEWKIEDELSEDPRRLFDTIVNPTYQICSYIHRRLKIVKTAECLERHPEAKSEYFIYSVRRLSDQERFVIGDIVSYTEKGFRWTIDNFIDVKGRIFARSKEAEIVEVINEELFKYDKEEEVLLNLRCEDGDAHEGDTVYGIAIQGSGNDIWISRKLHNEHSLVSIGSNRKWFLSQEKANEYLIMNSPVLSIADLHEIGLFDKKINLWDKISPEPIINLVKKKIGHKSE